MRGRETAVRLFCAVDVRGGRCVRLRQGDYDAETIYDDDPVGVASALAAAGAHWIHVVDLDGARSGRPENAAVVSAVAAAVDVPVQAGGGVRTEATAEAWFAAGVERVVVGTAALSDPELIRSLARSHRVAVGLDARAGELATDGWRRASGRSVLDAARRFIDVGVDALVVTDITRDGMLRGPDLSGLSKVLDVAARADTAPSADLRASASDVTASTAAAAGVEIIASGGVASLDDLRSLASLRGGSDGRRRLSGVIVGKALYEKRFTVAEAAEALSVRRDEHEPVPVRAASAGRPRNCDLGTGS